MAKICSICNKEKGLIDFSIDRSTSDYKRPWCRACGKSVKLKRDTELRPGMPEQKQCTGCKEVKPHTEFHRNKGNASGLVEKCRTCKTAKHKADYAINKHKLDSSNRRSYYRLQYGLTLEQVEQMKLTQDNKCKICLTELTTPRVDHCHVTNKVRGLLCHNCNVGLGHFKDSIPLLDKAKEYLNDFINKGQ